jgi:hypothetical protein
LQLTPSDDLGGFGEHRFDLHPLNRVGGPLRFDHPADQEVLLLGHRRDGGPLVSSSFFQRMKMFANSFEN